MSSFTDGVQNNFSDIANNVSQGVQDLVNTTSQFSDFLNRMQESSQVVSEYLNQVQKGKAFTEYVVKAYCDGGIDLPKISKVLTIDNTAFSIAMDIYKFFLPLGIIMLVLYLLMDILNITTNRLRELDIKVFMTVFLKGAIGLVLLKYGPVVIKALIETANTVVQAVIEGKVFGGGAGSTSKDDYYLIILEEVTKMGFFGKLGLAATSTILYIGQAIPEVAIMLQAVSRKIEIIYRVGMAPISLTDIYNGISNSKALIYLKRLAVCLLHGALMIMIVKITYELETTHMADMLSSMKGQGLPSFTQVIEICLYGYAAAGLIASSKSALNDAIGC